MYERELTGSVNLLVTGCIFYLISTSTDDSTGWFILRQVPLPSKLFMSSLSQPLRRAPLQNKGLNWLYCNIRWLAWWSTAAKDKQEVSFSSRHANNVGTLGVVGKNCRAVFLSEGNFNYYIWDSFLNVEEILGGLKDAKPFASGLKLKTQRRRLNILIQKGCCCCIESPTIILHTLISLNRFRCGSLGTAVVVSELKLQTPFLMRGCRF